MDAAYPPLEEITEERYREMLQELVALRAAAQAGGAVITLTPTVKMPKPEVFGGGRTVERWVFALEQYFNAVGLQHGADRVCFAATLLRGAAADWWRRVVVYASHSQQRVFTWDEFKVLIVQHFHSVDGEDFARRKLCSIRQTRSIRNYADRFQKLILQAPSMDEQSRVDMFVAGLKADVRRWVKLQDPCTLMAAVSAAENYQTTLLHDRSVMRTYDDLSRDAEDQVEPMELGLVG